MVEFGEANLNGSRPQLYRKLQQNIIQGGGNTAVINTESLRYLTEKEVEEHE
jgi:hypothetical protein|tara:strand:- start:461 stop:616 length:156 start_codon:yes stop_codon:yes gene_type:complete